MNKPPKVIDGALVIEWAWSGDKPFGQIYDSSNNVAVEIYGLAICQYESSGSIYRFSCNRDWSSEQDSNYNTVAAAKDSVPKQYKNTEIKWHEYAHAYNKSLKSDAASGAA